MLPCDEVHHRSVSRGAQAQCWAVAELTDGQGSERESQSEWFPQASCEGPGSQSICPHPGLHQPSPAAISSEGHAYLTPLAFLCPKVRPRILLMCPGIPAPSLRGPAQGCLLAKSCSGISEGLKINSRERPTHCPQGLLLSRGSPGPSVPSRPPISCSAPTWAPFEDRATPRKISVTKDGDGACRWPPSWKKARTMPGSSSVLDKASFRIGPTLLRSVFLLPSPPLGKKDVLPPSHG